MTGTISPRRSSRASSSAAGGGVAQQAREAAAAPGAKLQQTFDAVKDKLPAGLLGSHDGPRDHELYDTLGIADDATDAEIRAAYSERKHEVLPISCFCTPLKLAAN